MAMFASFMSRTISANEQYFSLTINQRTVFSIMPFEQSKQGQYLGMEAIYTPTGHLVVVGAEGHF